MTRPLIRLKTPELIAHAQASAADPIALQTCLDEIGFRKKAIKAGKFDDLIPWIESQIKVSEATPRASGNEGSIIDADEPFIDTSKSTRFDLNKVELEAFMLLCACFVISDKKFSSDF